MTPKLAQAVDPVFLHVLDLIDRINGDEQPLPQEERVRVRALLDQSEAIVGSGPEWEMTKYALVSWIDEMLVDIPWKGQAWWSDNVLEVEVFQTRLCSERFYLRAQEASTLSRRDALEVFYVCVVLGFRGLYRDPAMAQMLTQTHGLPPDLETWARQISMSIRLGQGRPPLDRPSQDVRGAPPLRAKSRAVWPWLMVLALVTCDVVFLYFKA